MALTLVFIVLKDELWSLLNSQGSTVSLRETLPILPELKEGVIKREE